MGICGNTRRLFDMGIPVLIIGKSGSGKSTSLRHFTENIGVINILGKPFPFKNKLPSITTDNYDKVKNVLLKSEAKSLVIDDAGYLITNHFMREHASTGKGNGVFSLYNDIGDSFWGLIQFVIKELPNDKIVYLMMHEDKNDFGDIKPKTIGKMLDEKVCVEGMFSVALRCVFVNGEHKFLTQSDGYDITKSPMGMFDGTEIDNDLKLVDTKIREYWMEEY
jgi:energy-coupling factor transporter ATP-binding protein EcfA2